MPSLQSRLGVSYVLGVLEGCTVSVAVGAAIRVWDFNAIILFLGLMLAAVSILTAAKRLTFGRVLYVAYGSCAATTIASVAVESGGVRGALTFFGLLQFGFVFAVFGAFLGLPLLAATMAVVSGFRGSVERHTLAWCIVLPIAVTAAWGLLERATASHATPLHLFLVMPWRYERFTFLPIAFACSIFAGREFYILSKRSQSEDGLSKAAAPALT